MVYRQRKLDKYKIYTIISQILKYREIYRNIWNIQKVQRHMEIYIERYWKIKNNLPTYTKIQKQIEKTI